MPSDYIITADNTCDMPAEYYAQNGIDLLRQSYTVNEVTYTKDELSGPEFYRILRGGADAITSLTNLESATVFFEEQIKRSDKILHVTFSSGLSGSYTNVANAAKDVMRRNPGKHIVTVDTLCASMGEGLLLDKAISLQKEGKTIEENVDWLEKNKLKLCHYFTVNDLFFLHKGGRVSRASAILGSALSVKPILYVNNTGELELISKARGRKASLNMLIDYMAKQTSGSYGQPVFISHGDSPEDAQYVADLVSKKFSPSKIIINHIGPVIGTHAGPGTVALFFFGNERKK